MVNDEFVELVSSALVLPVTLAMISNDFLQLFPVISSRLHGNKPAEVRICFLDGNG